ncbi:YciI family protein [Paenibacillus beijingensis]|uniref:YCII-related domain-containing protein n=1 Tax=Paenibacillus beijingensis TaxID=1126833 RepID=A0A0D5NJB1_9BACL|nr:YciI family protein [Paenibacillus beijingensis]AJY75087.1 hypothetical protein VN24_11490 [Paenibacillus beijingensis]
MSYFAVFLKMVDPEKSAAHRPEHLAFLARLRDEGIVFASGRFSDGSGGLVIYKADSLEAAEKWVSKDPYLIHGARRAEIHEWEMVTNAVLPQ